MAHAAIYDSDYHLESRLVIIGITITENVVFIILKSTRDAPAAFRQTHLCLATLSMQM